MRSWRRQVHLLLQLSSDLAVNLRRCKSSATLASVALSLASRFHSSAAGGTDRILTLFVSSELEDLELLQVDGLGNRAARWSDPSEHTELVSWL